MKRLLAFIYVITLSFGTAGTSNAILWDRGDGMIYDDVLEITWLQNANLAATETFGVPGMYPHGYMDWNTAQNWIAAMNAANYKGYNDWRLPRTVDGPFVWGYNGTTTAGYNITSSEMGYMYYVNLDNLGYYDKNGDAPQQDWGLKNTGPFNNLAVEWPYY